MSGSDSVVLLVLVLLLFAAFRYAACLLWADADVDLIVRCLSGRAAAGVAIDLGLALGVGTLFEAPALLELKGLSSWLRDDFLGSVAVDFADVLAADEAVGLL